MKVHQAVNIFWIYFLIHSYFYQGWVFVVVVVCCCRRSYQNPVNTNRFAFKLCVLWPCLQMKNTYTQGRVENTSHCSDVSLLNPKLQLSEVYFPITKLAELLDKHAAYYHCNSMSMELTTL